NSRWSSFPKRVWERTACETSFRTPLELSRSETELGNERTNARAWNCVTPTGNKRPVSGSQRRPAPDRPCRRLPRSVFHVGGGGNVFGPTARRRYGGVILPTRFGPYTRYDAPHLPSFLPDPNRNPRPGRARSRRRLRLLGQKPRP